MTQEQAEALENIIKEFRTEIAKVKEYIRELEHENDLLNVYNGALKKRVIAWEKIATPKDEEARQEVYGMIVKAIRDGGRG